MRKQSGRPNTHTFIPDIVEIELSVFTFGWSVFRTSVICVRREKLEVKITTFPIKSYKQDKHNKEWTTWDTASKLLGIVMSQFILILSWIWYYLWIWGNWWGRIQSTHRLLPGCSETFIYSYIFGKGRIFLFLDILRKI